MALWNSMPDIGKSGVAQMFFTRFVTEPIAPSALEAGAKLFYQEHKIPKAAADALKKGVQERCEQLGHKNVDEERLAEITQREMIKAAAEYSSKNIAAFMAKLPIETIIEQCMPTVIKVVRECMARYFGTNREGTDIILALINRVSQERSDDIDSSVAQAIVDATTHHVPRMAPDLARMRQARHGVDGNGQ
jgi:hypothetical protein